MSIQRTPEILANMAATFRERNAVYKDCTGVVAAMTAALWPHGVDADTVGRPEYMSLLMIVNKIARFVASDLTHVDSVHDIAVYAAMIEAMIGEKD